MVTKLPRHVLITGGSRGIGLAIAQLFAKNNYRCTLIARNEEALKAAVSTLQPLTQPPPTCTSATSADSATSASTDSYNSISATSSSDMFEFLDDDNPASASRPLNSETPTSSAPYHTSYTHAYIPGSIINGTHFWSSSPSQPLGSVLPHPSSNPSSRIDVLINCAGISQSKLFVRTGEEEMTNMIALNLTAAMMGTRYLLRHGYLRGDKGGEDNGVGFTPSIINVSSLLGLSGGFGSVTYAASKAGLLGFTRALATEYASHRVRVNAIVPGYIKTDMTKDLNSGQLKQRIPLERFGTPEEVASAALFLAENGYAHNCVLGLDGGLSAV